MWIAAIGKSSGKSGPWTGNGGTLIALSAPAEVARTAHEAGGKIFTSAETL
jgi:hypothetical protein